MKAGNKLISEHKILSKSKPKERTIMSSEKYHPLDVLQQIEDERGSLLLGTSKTRIDFLKREFKFIDILLSLQSFIHECYMLEVIQKVQVLRNHVFRLEHVGPDFDLILSQAQNKIWTTKLEIRAEYYVPKMSFDELSSKKRGVATNPIFVMEFIDSVVENLSDIGKICDSHSSQVEEVLKELNLLTTFVCFASNRCIEPQSQHDFFTPVLVLAGHAAIIPWLYFPCHANGDQDLALNEMNILLSELLRMRIKPIQPCIRKVYVEVLQALKSTQSRWLPVIPIEYVAECEASFVKSLLHNLEEVSTVGTASRIVALKDQMATLHEMLNLLRANLVPLPTQDVIFHIQDIDTVIVDAGLLVYSLYDNEEEDGTFEEKNEAPDLDFPSNIQHIKAVIYLIIRKAFQSNLPRIHGLGYVDFLLNNLKEFQGRYSNSLDFVSNQLQRIQDELESVQFFLKDVAEERHNKQDRLQDCATLLIGKAYEVEFVVDACISKEVPYWCLEHWSMDIIEEIILIKTEVMQIQEKKMVEFGLVLHDTTATADASTRSATTPVMNQEIVGFEDVMGTLKEKLIKGSKELDVVSIVGMPGLGKTTLANKLYFDELVVSHFDIRAQCVVSQVYTRKELLLVILRDAVGNIPVFEKPPSDAEVADRLRKVLLPTRYLILVDDIWETAAWDDLRSCFYDANNGSRIILTTRDHEVAIYAKSVSYPLQLRMFKEDESWKLLEKKVFGKENFSPHLIEVGQEIAKKCGRLPLSVVLVAGILAKTEKKEQCWRQVAEELGPHIHNDSKDIIERSYQHLPYHLRLCFLYFGAFLEDEEIKVSKLTRLWISEGFIKRCKDENLEDTADCYLENLIGRNVVTDVKKSSTGKVKTCRIHDLLLDFCKERASKENFLLWIKRNQNANPSCCIYSHKQLAQRRMSIYGGKDNLEAWSSSCSLVGSVFYRNERSVTIDQASHFFRNFKFLKVLDLEFIYVDSIPTELPYLRYFAATMTCDIVTSSIVNLTNLETLILRSSGRSFSQPIALLKIVKLRHLQTYFETYFTSHVAEELLVNNSSKFYELETLSTLRFTQANDMELMLRKAPNLRNLKCSLNDYSKSFPVLDFLTKLESIKIYSRRLPFGRDAYIFPSNLKKLTLCYAKLGGHDESNIAMLPNLQVLKLKWIEFYNKEWKVSNDIEYSFPQLKVLKIVYCYWFDKWNVSDDAFPCLERLVLSGCKRLKGIPSHFEDKPSLKSIEVKSCKESVVKSAMDIQEAQVDYMQNYGFKVFINK